MEASGKTATAGSGTSTRRSEETKQRLFEAATAEFTSHGIAGARIDRIAHAAGVNKQRIYAYFGNKRQLFETVVGRHVTRFLTEVAFDAHDLPAYAAASFDFFTAHPEIVHLGAWHALEPGESDHPIAIIERAIAQRTRAVARAQADGSVAPDIPARELLALVNAIARSWAVATPERNPRGRPGPRAVERRRAAVVEATMRLVAPGDRS
jgi:AcrR family transcriptional regulator